MCCADVRSHHEHCPTYNPVLIDDRNDEPFLKAFVAIFAASTVALLIAVA